jgi:hypothetical protein
MQGLVNKADDPPPALHCPLTGEPEEHEIVNVPAVVLYLEHPFNKMVERVEVDQGIELAQKIADRDADRFAVVGEGHH